MARNFQMESKGQHITIISVDASINGRVLAVLELILSAIYCQKLNWDDIIKKRHKEQINFI